MKKLEEAKKHPEASKRNSAKPGMKGAKSAHVSYTALFQLAIFVCFRFFALFFSQSLFENTYDIHLQQKFEMFLSFSTEG